VRKALRRTAIHVWFRYEEWSALWRFLWDEWRLAHDGWHWLIAISVFTHRVEWMIEESDVVTHWLYKDIRRQMLRKKVCRAREIPGLSAM